MLVTEDMHHRVGWSAYSIGLKAGAAARALSTEGRAALRNFCEHVVRRVLRRRSSFLSLSLSLTRSLSEGYFCLSPSVSMAEMK